MPEWSIGTVSKTVVPLRVPRVRIPLFPQQTEPISYRDWLFFLGFYIPLFFTPRPFFSLQQDGKILFFQAYRPTGFGKNAATLNLGKTGSTLLMNGDNAQPGSQRGTNLSQRIDVGMSTCVEAIAGTLLDTGAKHRSQRNHSLVAIIFPNLGISLPQRINKPRRFVVIKMKHGLYKSPVTGTHGHEKSLTLQSLPHTTGCEIDQQKGITKIEKPTRQLIACISRKRIEYLSLIFIDTKYPPHSPASRMKRGKPLHIGRRTERKDILMVSKHADRVLLYIAFMHHRLGHTPQQGSLDNQQVYRPHPLFQHREQTFAQIAMTTKITGMQEDLVFTLDFKHIGIESRVTHPIRCDKNFPLPSHIDTMSGGIGRDPFYDFHHIGAMEAAPFIKQYRFGTRTDILRYMGRDCV